MCSLIHSEILELLWDIFKRNLQRHLWLQAGSGVNFITTCSATPWRIIGDMVQDKSKPTFFFPLYMIRLFFKTIANTTENACMTQLNTPMSNLNFFSLGKIMQYWRTFFECYCVAMQRKGRRKKEKEKREGKKAIPPESTKTDRSTERQHYKAKTKRNLPVSLSDLFSCSVSVRVSAELDRLDRQELRPDLTPRPHSLMACSGDITASFSVSASDPALIE